MWDNSNLIFHNAVHCIYSHYDDTHTPSLLTNHPIPPPIHMYMYVHNQSRVNTEPHYYLRVGEVCASNLAPYLLCPFMSHILDLGSYLYMYIEISHLIHTQFDSIFIYIHMLHTMFGDQGCDVQTKH